MKHTFVRTIFLATLLLSLAAIASAQDFGMCSPFGVAGEWGYSETGTLYLPSGPVPYVVLGKFTVDLAGNYTGQRTASVGGNISSTNLKGTITVNSDCTGTQTISLLDNSGNVTSTATKNLVFVDYAREYFGILTSVTLANGVSLNSAMTTTAKKLFPRQL